MRLEPQPPGQWRWVGTKTLLFEPDPRFPQATEYRATVKAGTRSATGAVLAEDFATTFRTPPPAVERFHPQPPTTFFGPWTDRQPVIFIGFDQRVEPATVLANTTAQANGTPVGLRLATAAEVAEDETVESLSREAGPDRWVALRPTAPLAVGSAVTVTLGADLTSAEGPRPMGSPWEFSFHVYNPLRVEGLRCDRPEPRDDDEADGGPVVAGTAIAGCEPGGDWYVDLNNNLDPKAFEPTAFKIAPEIAGAAFKPAGNFVDIDAESVGRSAYTVTLPAGLTDVYGQTLGAPVEVRFSTGDASPALYVPGEDMLVLDPAAGGKLTVAEVNNAELEVSLFRVTPDDWGQFEQWQRDLDDYRRGYEEHAERPEPPWPSVWTGTVTTGGEQDALTPVDIDLAPALADGFGQVVVLVEPVVWNPDDPFPANRPGLRWVQVTRLGLAYSADGESARVWVTDLGDGTPVGGVTVNVRPEGGSAVTDDSGLARCRRRQRRAGEPWSWPAAAATPPSSSAGTSGTVAVAPVTACCGSPSTTAASTGRASRCA